MDSLLEPEKQVLSTLERDGSRRWLKPRLSVGRHLTRRRVVAYLLMAVYLAIPFVRVGGQPLVLLDIPSRRFRIFGLTFLPTDTVLLALFVVGTLLAFFLLTALVGRVWCGWACPHTVFMEFVFRPLERLFDRTSGRGGRPPRSGPPPRAALRQLTYFVVCWVLANVLLSYFVGVDAIWRWIRQSPIEHPVPFVVMASVTIAVFLHFSWFREQLCIIACPYGRFQSVLLDHRSLIVSYDARRGEPRATKGQARKLAVVGQRAGDCIDCGLCHATCPTGIDIRNGLQMECVNCTQCIDACDDVMSRVGRPTGLIRYSSQAQDAGERQRWLRPRVIVYPAILAVVAGSFLTLLLGRTSFDAVVLRAPGHPFIAREDGELIRNELRLKLTNRTLEPATFRVEIEGVADPVVSVHVPLVLDAEATGTFPMSIDTDPRSFRNGEAAVQIHVFREGSDERALSFRLLGPVRIPGVGDSHG